MVIFNFSIISILHKYCWSSTEISLLHIHIHCLLCFSLLPYYSIPFLFLNHQKKKQVEKYPFIPKILQSTFPRTRTFIYISAVKWSKSGYLQLNIFHLIYISISNFTNFPMSFFLPRLLFNSVWYITLFSYIFSPLKSRTFP